MDDTTYKLLGLFEEAIMISPNTLGAANLRKELVELLDKFRQESYNEGVTDGLREYAWWKDGTQYVGSCGTTLKEALERPIGG